MIELLCGLFPNVVEMHAELLEAIVQTAVTIFVSGIFGIALGSFSGIVLVVTRPGGLYEKPWLNSVLEKVINTVRSIPFVILIALLVSVTRFLVGTSIGVRGAIPPLILGIIPLTSRVTEQSLLEVDSGVIEAARAMGISRSYIVLHVLLAEGRPGLVRALITSFVSLLGLSTMAGSVGGGGIGSFAIRYGYSRYMNDITLVTVILLLLIVNAVQAVGNHWAKKLTH